MNETEWDSLAELWTSSRENVDAAPLQKIVAAHRRRLIAGSVCEGLTLVALVWLTYAVLRDGIATWELVWAITLWSFAAIALLFVWWNRRGTWRTMGDSVAEHVRITRVRAKRQRASLRFAVGLFIVEAIAVIAQLIWFGRLTSMSFVLLAASAVLVAAWVLAGHRRITRDLRVVEEFERYS